ncbi:MAG: hypothetical protein ACI9DM_002191 [Cyclobacteriaceae bacterium]|jgi:hypothetical protein
MNFDQIREGYDSDEEVYFTWYLDELVEAGMVKYYFKNTSPIKLTSEVTHNYVKKMKRVADKQLTQTILKGSEYTPDFDIFFTAQAKGIFVSQIGDGTEKIDTPFIADASFPLVSVETKGSFDQNNMTRLVRNNIKFLYQRHGIFINLLMVPDIFKKTFTPQRYLLTNKTKKPRTINFKTISLDQFINSKTN